MANIFLDTNLLFDIVIRNKKKATILKDHNLYISPLSYHIYCYSEDVKIPDKNLSATIGSFTFVSLTQKILEDAMSGPTSDLEDNIQLFSAYKCGADIFLTNDKKLIKMKLFGKTKIVSTL